MFLPIVYAINDGALNYAPKVFLHKAGKRHGPRMVKKIIEFVLDPADPLRGIVLPEDFVILTPAGKGFVDASDKRGLAAVGQGDDAGLAVNEAEDMVGYHLYFHLAGGKKIEQSGIPGGRNAGIFFGLRFAPLPAHGVVRGRQSGEVLEVKTRIADDPHPPLHCLYRLSGRLKY